MEGFDLPMSFGKKAVAAKSTTKGRVDKTKRAEDTVVVKNDAAPAIGSSAGSAKKRPHEEAENGRRGEPSGTSNGHNGTGAVPSALAAEAAIDEEEDDSDDMGSEPEAEDPFPVSHEIVLKDHTKVLSAMGLDPSGARLATGSHDYDVKIWDFGGMDSRLKPFKSFEPCESYPIHDVAFSPDGQNLLIVAGTTQAKLYTRDGEDGVVFNKGDPYVRDMRHTNGHVAEITSAQWHPKQSDQFITASNDSTIRIWNVDTRMKQKTVIVVKSREKGTRTQITACAYSPDGKWIAGAGKDGSIHIWAVNSNFSRPNQSNEDAHARGTETSGLAFSRDGRHLVSRGGDDTVKLWDVKSLKKPLYTASSLTNVYPETNVIFSPDEKYILTGIAVEKGEKGEIVVLNREGLTEDRRIVVGEGNVVKVVWHSRMNQIFASTSKGACHVLYSPNSSIRGALLPLAKMPKTAPREQVYTSNLPPVIMTPHALPQFQDQDYRQTKRQKEKARNDPIKGHKPQEPIVGAGKGGRVGASATQHLVQHMFQNPGRDEDPREALLKYADKAESDPVWTSAWKQNQPKPVFDENPDYDTPEGKKKKLPKEKRLEGFKS